MARAPAAPGRLTAMTGTPSSFSTKLATVRAVMSETPPGAAWITTVIWRVGYWAETEPAKKTVMTRANTSANPRWIRTVSSSPRFWIVHR